MQDDNNIQDGEVVSAELTSQTPTEVSETMILENLESMIRENLSKIDKLELEARQQKEMIDSVLGNDEIYLKHDEALKQAQKVKNGTKQEILKRPDVAHVATKFKELREEIKEIKESMTSYLQEYQRLSGSTEIEDDKGEMRQIIYVAKLVKRKA